MFWIVLCKVEKCNNYHHRQPPPGRLKQGMDYSAGNGGVTPGGGLTHIQIYSSPYLLHICSFLVPFISQLAKTLPEAQWTQGFDLNNLSRENQFHTYKDTHRPICYTFILSLSHLLGN